MLLKGKHFFQNIFSKHNCLFSLYFCCFCFGATIKTQLHSPVNEAMLPPGSAHLLPGQTQHQLGLMMAVMF